MAMGIQSVLLRLQDCCRHDFGIEKIVAIEAGPVEVGPQHHSRVLGLSAVGVDLQGPEPRGFSLEVGF